MPEQQKTRAILLDIEGTTTPIDFVHKTLFPFARERMPEFVRDNFGRLQDEIASLHVEHKLDSEKAKTLRRSMKQAPSRSRNI